MNDKFIKKFMRLAKFFSEDQISCLSRGIGAVVIDPTTPKMRLVSSGYNGPVRGAPRNDSYKYLREVVWPQLTDEDKRIFGENLSSEWNEGCVYSEVVADVLRSDCSFAESAQGCGFCPRYMIGAKSGERMEVCVSCSHAERNAIFNATEDLNGFHMYAYCGIPCNDCTIAIIQSGISRVYCLKAPEQSIKGNNGYGFERSRWLFDNCSPRVEVVELEESWVLNG